MFKAEELDINYFVDLAASHVGEVHTVGFQTMAKYGEEAGKFEILEYIEEDPHFTFRYWLNRDNNTPDGAKLGYYRVKLTGTKFYNGKIFRVPVSASVQGSKKEDEGKILKEIFVESKNADTGKWLKAYEFGFIDFGVRVYK